MQVACFAAHRVFSQTAALSLFVVLQNRKKKKEEQKNKTKGEKGESLALLDEEVEHIFDHTPSGQNLWKKKTGGKGIRKQAEEGEKEKVSFPSILATVPPIKARRVVRFAAYPGDYTAGGGAAAPLLCDAGWVVYFVVVEDGGQWG